MEVANILYDAVLQIATLAHSLNIHVSIENPGNSLMWKTTPLKPLVDNPAFHSVLFHNCAHGGTRDKLTCFLTTAKFFDALALRCDKSHAHESWQPKILHGKPMSPTHLEAAYPELLCQRIATLVRAYVDSNHAAKCEDLKSSQRYTTKSLNRVVLGALPRGKHVAPLVSEYGAYYNIVLPAQQHCSIKFALSVLPKGTDVQSRSLLQWGAVRIAMEKQAHMTFLLERDLEWTSKLKCIANTNYVVPDDVACLDYTTTVERVTLRVPREPMDFLKKAVEAGHPRGCSIALPIELEKVVTWNRDASCYDLHVRRISFVKKWTERAKEVSGDDCKMVQEAPHHLRKLLSGKRVALWGEMLQHYGYPDKELFERIANGFPLVGWMPRSHVFPADSREPSLDPDTLAGMSKGLNARVKSKVLGDNDPILEQATWDETTKEVEAGWMEFDTDAPVNSAWAMRFGLQHRDKIRVIDDFTIAGINQCVGLSERMKIFGIDDIAALLAKSLDTAAGQTHPQMLGKTIDLKHAYKQFGIRCQDRARARVATVNPSTKKLITLLVNALPFGATGSVSAFLRVSMSIWYLGVVGLGLSWTCFYDDFTLLSRHDACKVTEWAAESLLNLLGVVFAKEGKKATSFDKTFASLGVIFDVSCICNKRVEIKHTEVRREELVQTVSDMLDSKLFSPKELERLRGRLLWFENFVCGRQANSHIAKLGNYIGASKKQVAMLGGLRVVLGAILERVTTSQPVVITPDINRTWLFFTGGACEDSSSVGGVLIHPCGRAAFFFGEMLPETLEQAVRKDSKHPIYEVEILAILIALLLWGKLVWHAQTVFYLDNDAARSGFIRGSGATCVADVLIRAFCFFENALNIKSWFSRVPSHSNIADDPSRLNDATLSALGARKCAIDWKPISQVLLSSRLDMGMVRGLDSDAIPIAM